ncbi:Oidioi.mRNA.OKI2018_I69.chr1.g1646.t1.cds [Oikopleura dioica]|uniref:Oidioi.mRNA.OKI2018_I69.chr1.g1646.t1.cds n=1 Tax=Oikopleura dioica TaxID=34765 RepID=A0ABN7SP20_OIKDI|nr:Oidioi.mRNA.OKI2018_I69.chr1.g1646.t1.cds [Oikopleura dioica]
MKGWFQLIIDYRERLGLKHEADAATSVGIMRDFDNNNEHGTKIAKHYRKRVTERMNKKSLESEWVEAINGQEDFILDEFRRRGKEGKLAIDPAPVFWETALGESSKMVMFKFAIGIDLREKPKRLEKLIRCGKAGIEAFDGIDQHSLIFEWMPKFIRKFIPISLWPDYIKEQSELLDEIIEIVAEVKAENEQNENESSLISVFENDVKLGKMNHWDAIWTIHQLIIAGNDTVAISLRTFLINMAKHQEEQERIRNALKERNYGQKELKDCPRLFAAIYESFRYSPTVSESTPFHTITEDTTIRDMKFKKGDLIRSAIGAMSFHVGKEDPFKFASDRFLDENGDFRKYDASVPYHVGRRDCPGQILANIQLFHISKIILKHFRLTTSEMSVFQNLQEFENIYSGGKFTDADHYLPNLKENRVVFVPISDE